MATRHVPVLLREVITYLNPQSDKSYLDGTVGGGGHTLAILQHAAPSGQVIGLDRDPGVMGNLPVELKEMSQRFVAVTASYELAPEILAKHNWQGCDGIVLDLGFSSDQLADPTRGLTHQETGPLDLRFDPTSDWPATTLLTHWSDRELAQILSEYGDLRAPQGLVKRIRAFQRHQSILSTDDLIAATGLRHPRRLAQLFQALRIATNDELGTLTRALPKLWTILNPGGRLVIISFHSGEDRIVKQAFVNWTRETQAKILTKKPILPSVDEVRQNPRARSAKLRAIKK